MKTVNSFVLGYFGLRRCRCMVEVFATNNYTAVIHYHLHTSDMCKRNQILMAVYRKTDYSSLFSLEIHGHTFYINFDQNNEVDSLYELEQYVQRFRLAFPAHRGCNCPRPWLNHTELEHVQKSHSSRTSLQYYMKGDLGNFVCLDNYIQINEGTDLYKFPNVFYSMFCIFYLV